ncbi:SGNH hydrolase-type esterase domain-containing protein [Gautieria morchelliformis]|nr:SGNH hydrolase-type esterase domain-containing protein [Gautieria morchelliformis]
MARLLEMLLWFSFGLILMISSSPAVTASSNTALNIADPRVHLNGSWDEAPGTWWTGSGFKLYVENLSSLTLNLGPHTTQPWAAIGCSVNYGPFQSLNVSEGVNILPLDPDPNGMNSSRSVVRINAQGWQNNRLNVESIVLNPGAKALTYKPSRIAFQFIGDSLSAGQFLDNGVDGAWPFITGETFRAEHNVNAQPGAALTDILSFGNVHGVSYQFFRTEDTGFYYTSDHNFTTPWSFKKDIPGPTHVVIHIGANDAAQNITGTAFVDTYLKFTDRLRRLYPYQPFFVLTPWGWPNADGTIGQYYEGRYGEIVNTRHSRGDKNIFLVNTTNWVTYADVFPGNQHPNAAGHRKIAGLFTQWLKEWGLYPAMAWATPVQ